MGLLERESHLQSLHAWLGEIADDSGLIALLSGEAGIGKTSLLQQFAGEYARSKADDTVRILWGGCEALFTPHPLGPLYDIARQIGGTFPHAIDVAGGRDAVFNLTIEELARGPLPTVIVFEDVHWADEATLDLIKFLGRRLQQLHVLLIVSYRDEEVDERHPLRAVIGDLPTSRLRRLRLSPLSAAAVAVMADAAGRPAADLHAITGGNPFFVTEVLAAADNAVPATVRDAVIARLARMSEAARAIANVVSLVPGKAERWLLDKVVGSNASAIQECLSLGMVSLADGSVAFRHELARRAVEENLSIPIRQDLHASILLALQRHIGSEIVTARLVHHADQANDSAAVLRLAPIAAERAAALKARREAAAYYETALRHGAGLDAEERALLQEKWAYECYLTEYIDKAIEGHQAALKFWRDNGCSIKIGDNLRWLSRLSWFNGQNDEAERYAKEAIAVLETVPPSRELAMAYSNCAQLYMLANEAELTLAWGQKAIDLATPLNDREILSHAFNNMGTVMTTALDPRGFDYLKHSLELALADGLQEHAARAYTNFATTAIRLRKFAEANQYLKDGLAYCEAHGLDSWLRYMSAARALSSLAQGDWNRAAEEAEAVFAHPCVAPVSKIQILIVLGLVRARRGDPDAQPPLAEALALAHPTGEMQRIGPVIAARAEIAWLQGTLSQNVAELHATYELALQQSDPWTQSELAFWLWRAGETIDSSAIQAKPFALQVAGEWRAAASLWHAMGCVYEQAVALADSSEEVDLREGLQIAQQLGAAPLASLLRRKLRASGIRGISRGMQERNRQNPHGLTTRELGVLAQLTQGYRNADIARRLFVSEKTIDHHVSSILGKLGVRSRGEAAAMAGRLGLASPGELIKK